MFDRAAAQAGTALLASVESSRVGFNPRDGIFDQFESAAIGNVLGNATEQIRRRLGLI